MFEDDSMVSSPDGAGGAFTAVNSTSTVNNSNGSTPPTSSGVHVRSSHHNHHNHHHNNNNHHNNHVASSTSTNQVALTPNWTRPPVLLSSNSTGNRCSYLQVPESSVGPVESSSSVIQQLRDQSRTGSATPTQRSSKNSSADSPLPAPSPPVAPSSQLDAQNLLYARHPYLYKSPLLSPQSGDQQDRSGAGSAGAAASSNAVSMWPPLVMPLHLGKQTVALADQSGPSTSF